MVSDTIFREEVVQFCDRPAPSTTAASTCATMCLRLLLAGGHEVVDLGTDTEPVRLALPRQALELALADSSRR